MKQVIQNTNIWDVSKNKVLKELHVGFLHHESLTEKDNSVPSPMTKALPSIWILLSTPDYAILKELSFLLLLVNVRKSTYLLQNLSG